MSDNYKACKTLPTHRPWTQTIITKWKRMTDIRSITIQIWSSWYSGINPSDIQCVVDEMVTVSSTSGIRSCERPINVWKKTWLGSLKWFVIDKFLTVCLLFTHSVWGVDCYGNQVLKSGKYHRAYGGHTLLIEMSVPASMILMYVCQLRTLSNSSLARGTGMLAWGK